MNERLENLFEQAFEYARTESDVRSNRAVVEKFAELIVAECLHIVDDEGAGEGGCIRAMIRIQEHFGVEQ